VHMVALMPPPVFPAKLVSYGEALGAPWVPFGPLPIKRPGVLKLGPCRSFQGLPEPGWDPMGPGKIIGWCRLGRKGPGKALWDPAGAVWDPQKLQGNCG
jgi:hypothetical protein